MKPKLSRQYWAGLGMMTAFCLLGLLIRNKLTGNNSADVDLNFMLWNLFLAWVPLPLAWLSYALAGRVSKVVVVLITFAWLLFYPNAPYMISDVIHVNKDAQDILLYDGLIIFSFAMLALFYGFISMKIIHLVYRTIAGTKTANLVIAASILLSSAGIYLGRILRLNSWDFFTRPLQVLKTIADHLFPVNQNPTTYLIIFFFSAIQFLLLLLMKDLEEVENNKVVSHEKRGRTVVKTDAPASSGLR